ncbi:class I SAM-dependent methyltransferase [Vallitalea okinawensis]|uniref:class I SAM-dependent methyltransferase n=1 Tax=Vallitalea okinawensis TaxID=2078660 RepID=UPI001FA833F3|nr:class I SAM-dependent methyltransferase [Vallitalea okinawensis]
MSNYSDVWDNYYKHKANGDITYDLWLDKYQDQLEMSKDIPIIDLGCGGGNNTLYLIERGYKPIACDYSVEALNALNKAIPQVETRQFDLLEGLPFSANGHKVVIADLCLHYFSWEDTLRIVKDIKTILSKDGYLICRLNSVRDEVYGAGKGLEIEENYYQVHGRKKRYFNEEQVRALFDEWDILHIEEYQMTRIKDKILWEVALRKRG